VAQAAEYLRSTWVISPNELVQFFARSSSLWLLSCRLLLIFYISSLESCGMLHILFENYFFTSVQIRRSECLLYFFCRSLASIARFATFGNIFSHQSHVGVFPAFLILSSFASSYMPIHSRGMVGCIKSSLVCVIDAELGRVNKRSLVNGIVS